MFIGVIIRLVMSFINNRKQNQRGQNQGVPGQAGHPSGDQPQGGQAQVGPNPDGQSQYDQRPMMSRRARRRMR
jgi:hypothetical protein